jgi:bacillithiol system protein YtxJ
MNTPFVEIASIEALDAFMSKANGSVAMLFKHSNLCGVSARAYGELSSLDLPVGLIVVQEARNVSDEIEKRWQIGHETPQVLIVRDDDVLWNASHFDVKAATVSAALKAAGSNGDGG